MKYYLINAEERQNKEGQMFYIANVLDYSNKVVSDIFVPSNVYTYFIELLQEDLFPDISDNISLVYDKSKGYYKLIYKGE